MNNYSTFKLWRIRLILLLLLNVIFALVENVLKKIIIIKIILNRFVILKTRVNIISFRFKI